MSKYLIRASYTQQGLTGAIEEGFAARRASVTALIEGAGATVEAFYFTYGSDDVLVIIDGDEPTAIAFSLALNQSGAVEPCSGHEPRDPLLPGCRPTT